MCQCCKRKGTICYWFKVQFDNLCENVHAISLWDKRSIEDDKIIDLSKILKEE